MTTPKLPKWCEEKALERYPNSTIWPPEVQKQVMESRKEYLTACRDWVERIEVTRARDMPIRKDAQDLLINGAREEIRRELLGSDEPKEK